MEVATILPTSYMNLEQSNHYHMCLAHLLKSDAYLGFFREKAERGDMLIMDNGIVERGIPLSMRRLLILAAEVGATELILPDCLNDSEQALIRGLEAIRSWKGEVDLIAVPQGKSLEDWLRCLNQMLEWPVKTIGISRFMCSIVGPRINLLKAAPQLLESDKNIHLLGSPGISDELLDIHWEYGERIRGVDSGIAAIYAQADLAMVYGVKKPILELDFDSDRLDRGLLIRNIRYWLHLCGKGGGPK